MAAKQSTSEPRPLQDLGRRCKRVICSTIVIFSVAAGWEVIECYIIDTLLAPIDLLFLDALRRLLRLHAEIFDNITTLIIGKRDRSICPSLQKVQWMLRILKIKTVFVYI